LSVGNICIQHRTDTGFNPIGLGQQECARIRDRVPTEEKMKICSAFIPLLLLFVLPPAGEPQTVNGSINAAFAVGKWKESHEGVSLFCARVTTQKDVIKGDSNGVCFLTEAQATARDSVVMSTNTFAVTAWDEHSLAAANEFYADKNGDQTTKSSPGAIKFVFRLVLNFETHQMVKFVEASTGNTVGYHLEGQ
jgi:hypothetical protein